MYAAPQKTAPIIIAITKAIEPDIFNMLSVIFFSMEMDNKKNPNGISGTYLKDSTIEPTTLAPM